MHSAGYELRHPASAIVQPELVTRNDLSDETRSDATPVVGVAVRGDVESPIGSVVCRDYGLSDSGVSAAA